MRGACIGVLATFGFDSTALAQVFVTAPHPAPGAPAAATPAAVPRPVPAPAPPPQPAPRRAVTAGTILAPETTSAALAATDPSDPTTTAAHTYPAGWSLVSVPLLPSNPAASAVFDEVKAPLRLYDYVDGQVIPSGEAGFRNVAPGRAFWMVLAASTTVRASGQPIATSAEYRVAIKPGWNAIATPWFSAIGWTDAQVSVRNGTSTLALGAAVDQGWIEGTLDDPGSSGGYGTIAANSSPAGQLRPWRGYLLNSQITAELVFAPPPPDTTPPTVAFTTPDEGDEIATPTQIVGAADDDNLAGWTLDYSRDGSAFAPLAAGSEAVSGALGKVDPGSFENGLLVLRLTATDASGNAATAERTLVVTGDNKLGSFQITFKDLEVPVSGMPIVVSRTYDTRARAQSRDFGFGWTVEIEGRGRYTNNRRPGDGWRIEASTGIFGLPCRVVNETKGHLTEIRFSDREVYRFRLILSGAAPVIGACVATAAFQQVGGTPGATLEILGGTDVLYQSGANSVLDFSTFQVYEPQDVRLTTRTGRVLELNLRDGLRRVTDRNGNSLSISPAGIQHSSGKSVGFVRDAGGRITAIVDPDGQVISYAYDGGGNLQSVTDRQDGVATYDYDASHFLTRIVDPSGKAPFRNDYDADGRLVATTDGNGNRVEITTDPAANATSFTDARGNTRTMQYDAAGNLTDVTAPDGVAIRATFDPRGNILSETDALGHTTSRTYDAFDNVLSQQDAVGNTTSYTYDAHNRPLTVTDARGKTTINTYDAKGNLLSVKDALGNETVSTFDSKGNLLTRKDGAGCETRLEYDGAGNILKETDALGHPVSYTYDARGNRLTRTATRTTGGSVETLVTGYAYDGESRLTRTTDPDGTSTSTIYDEAGRKKTTTDKRNRQTTYEYDDQGGLIKTSYPDGTTEEAAYDLHGRRSAAVDRGGRTTQYEYDALGRLAKTTYPDGSTMANGYDKAGRLVTVTDARGKVRRYEYDDVGRRTKAIDPVGNQTVSTYDPNGNLASTRDPAGKTTSYEYDDLNRLVRTLYPDGTDTRATYDAVGRRLTETDQAGRTTRFAYDCLGRLTSVTDALGQVTRYGYDEVGSRVSQTDARDHVTAFEYDRLGRPTKRTLPLGDSESMTYDAAGNLLTRVDFSGVTTSYGYDASDRLLSRSSPSGHVAFTYTPNGQRATATDARGTTNYTYDARDRMISLTYPDGRKLEYGYDPAGNRTSLRATVGAATLDTSYAYDDAGRLATVTAPQGRSYTYGYDVNGNRASLAYPNGIATTYAYDTLNRLTGIGTSRGGAVVQSYAYTLGATGSRVQALEQDGTVRAYVYDPLYRLTRETVSGGPDAAYQNEFGYDAVGNRTSQTRAGSGVVSYAYDDRDRVLQAGSGGYTWDANGNLTARSGADGATYSWDTEHRLRRVLKADGTRVDYAYDADGNRVRSEVTPANGPPTVTDYLVDPAAPLSQVVADVDGSGLVSAFYVRGTDLLAVVRGTGTRFVHADGLGSIRRLTDEAGNVTDSYAYSAFGERLSHTGADPNAYQFAGEALDPNSGFYYNRARWLDTATGRFITPDPFAGTEFDPPSLHQYLYARLDPVSNTDPTGRFFSIGGMAMTAAIMGTLSSIGTMLYAGIVGKSRGEILRAGALGFLAGAGIAATLYAAVWGGFVAYIYVATGGLTFSQQVYQGFQQGRCYFIELSQDLPVQRWWGGGASQVGRWWTTEFFQNGVEAIERLSLPAENTAAEVVTGIIPKGTQILVGPAASQFGRLGGGAQVFVQSGQVVQIIR
jgi:RHS repeat-associated protein